MFYIVVVLLSRRLITMPDKVYLVGRIDGITYEEATGWRSYCKDRLGGKYVWLDPMEQKELLEQYNSSLTDSPSIETKIDPFLVFVKHLEMLKQADIVLANLNFLPSLETFFDLGYLFSRKNIVVTVCSNEYATHPFVEGCSDFVFPSVEDVCAWLEICAANKSCNR